jgi:hypothetical protein
MIHQQLQQEDHLDLLSDKKNMDNTRQIQPITFWQNGKTELAHYLMLYHFGGYDFATGQDCFVAYRLGDIRSSENEQTPSKFVVLREDTLPLPAELVAEWGEDDEPIWQYVLTQLDLQELP